MVIRLSVISNFPEGVPRAGIKQSSVFPVVSGRLRGRGGTQHIGVTEQLEKPLHLVLPGRCAPVGGVPRDPELRVFGSAWK